MAESSTGNETVHILETLVKILKDEDVFDTTGKKPVVNFVHPEELQVSSTISFQQFIHLPCRINSENGVIEVTRSFIANRRNTSRAI